MITIPKSNLPDRTNRAISKSLADDEKFFRENPGRRTRIRPALPHENPDTDLACLAVVRWIPDGFWKAFIAPHLLDEIDEDTSTEAIAFTFFLLLAFGRADEDFDHMRERVLRERLSVMPMTGRA